ncbi:YibE/F family protein [Salipaludibacillus agaradhaerens]|uniref:YibE/F family protein n=1 Tax=Salipaludibacillus agaradhaerens TaxID=76935 RepID=A0A9Q4G038_SALAG|nr:YibE/F family protein [Salipaludibacillus agaradhaerens]MCR6113043.1 YibE/F family protein [Salipaludibacillus agaradhaerens]
MNVDKTDDYPSNSIPLGGDFLKSLYQRLENISYKQWLICGIIVCCFTASIIFVHTNHTLYERPIAQVTSTEVVDAMEMTDSSGNEDELYTQHITAAIKNGEHKGETIELINEFSLSGGYDQEYQVGNEVFVYIDEVAEGTASLTGVIQDVKRDKYIMYVAWLFIFTLLIIGKKQGFFAMVSLAINALLLSYALDIYITTLNISLLAICAFSVLLFTAISLLLVNGFNQKTYAAVVATLLGTFSAVLITFFVMWITGERGLRYEEMQFLTRPPQMVFMAGVFIGSLGAVMDVAITMSASIFSLYEKDQTISNKALKASGLDIGKDIMGTMTNILFFAYISGSIPSLILYLKNGLPLGYTLSMNLSLELARALSGGIGIVLTIPLGIYASLYFVNKQRAKL